MTIYEGLGLEF